MLELQEQQELVLQEQQLEQEQLELDQASSTDSSVISSISNVALSRALSSSLSSTDMAILPMGVVGMSPRNGRSGNRGAPGEGAGQSGVTYCAASRTVPVTIPRIACRSIVVVSTNSARVPSA